MYKYEPSRFGELCFKKDKNGKKNAYFCVKEKELSEKQYSPRIPTILYHYTSREGFLNILNKKYIRMGSVFKTNDKNEYTYVIDLLEKRIQFMKDKKNTLYLDFFMNCVRENIREFFSFSLSSQKDELKQWQVYGSLGKGLVLGLNTRTIPAFSGLPFFGMGSSFSLVKINYQVSKQAAEIDNILRGCLRGKYELENAVLSICKIAVSCKDKFWCSEKEWRYVCSENLDPNYIRKDKDGFTIIRENKDYFTFSLFDKFISEIFIGPCCDLQEDEINDILLKNDFNKDNHIKILRSKCPLRCK